jgi:tRNA A-37 threonylcarbamoyl transferase component Bud32/membrane-associated phospholipid phosphatase
VTEAEAAPDSGTPAAGSPAGSPAAEPAAEPATEPATGAIADPATQPAGGPPPATATGGGAAAATALAEPATPEATPGPSPGRDRGRRRPTGAPPPLPRSLGTTGKLWLAALAVFVGWTLVLLVSPAAQRATDRADAAVLRQIVRLRTPWLTDVATAVDRVGTGWTLTIVALGLVVAQMVFRRWRHLFTFLASIIVMEVVALLLYAGFSRPRPYDVTAIGRWSAFSSPSPPLVVLSAVLVGILYSMVPGGSPRNRGKWVLAAALAVFGFVRLYLGVDHPFDVLAGLALGIAIPLMGFRLFTPNEYVPVAYRRGKTAHLDVTGKRGEAIRRAVHDQLGLTVLDAKPVGLEGSGGSTPLRLRVAGASGEDGDTYVFAKLFAMNHVRADRWYKMGRRILYGRLEDEARFDSVRRLVEYEDYAFRLLRDAGIPTAVPYGIVEITPEREYMLVISFIEGAREIGEVDVDDAIIDEAFRIMRRLWDAGLAHRDIKPANLMVADRHVYLIDAFFVQVRPSPWRQAVDLGNIMLVLAVRSEPERVYQRALAFFTEDDIAEAFAATRGVASPTQLRAVMRKDGRDLVGQFRAMAPARPRIGLQRWSLRRVGLALGLVVLFVLAALQTFGLFTPTHDMPVRISPECGTGRTMVLMAQAVPEATMVPCISTLPAGWELGDSHVERGEAKFWLDSDKGGDRAVEATLWPRAHCDVRGAAPVPSDEVGTERYERPGRLQPVLESTRYYVFPGGCVTYEFRLRGSGGAELLFDAEQALGFVPRERLVEHVRNLNDLALCGAGARCAG